jgi:hypothetical protein
LDSFERIYQLSESRQNASVLAFGVKAYFRINKYEKDSFDLILENPSNKKRVAIEKYASYRSGYDQTFNVSSKMKYYLVTESGYSAGNGQGVSSKTVPIIRQFRHLDSHIEEQKFFTDFIHDPSISIREKIMIEEQVFEKIYSKCNGIS